MVAVGCVVAFASACGSVDWISTRVGSSSPVISGLDWPFTFGSSLSTSLTPAGSSRSAWLVTTVPSGSDGASVTSNWIDTSLDSGTLMLRMSIRPAPLVPPFGSELSVAPGGRVPGTMARLPGWNTGSALSSPRSSKNWTSSSGPSVVCRRSV